MNETDIRILMCESFERAISPDSIRTVRLDAMDQELRFEPGTCAKHLDAAVKNSPFRIFEKGTIAAKIYRIPKPREDVVFGG